MNRFDRYILVIFLRYILVVQLFITTITLFSSAMSHLQGLKQFNITVTQLIKLELITIPLGLNSALPITIVVSSIITVLLMVRSKELLAYASLGGRIGRFIMPFIFAGFIATAFMIFFDATIYTKVRNIQSRYINETIKKQPHQSWRGLVDRWFVDETKIVNIGILDLVNSEARDITEYIIDNDFQITSIRTIPFAKQEGDIWHFTESTLADIKIMPPTMTIKPPEDVKYKLFDDLSSIWGKNPRELTPRELKEMIELMNNRGLSTLKYEMILLAKYANAFSVIVLIFIVIPIGIDFSRNYSIVINATKSFGLGIAFWAALATFYSFGTSGVLSPIMANFLPHIIFLCIGGVIIYRKERAK